MKGHTTRSVMLFLIAAGLAMACSATALAKPRINADDKGVAIKGYDTVAYFTREEPVKGSDEYSFEWKGATWFFSSREHLDMFAKNPEKYAPQYGGY